MNWYGNIKFILAFLCFSLAVAFRINRLKFFNTKPLFSIDDWLLKSADAESDVKVVTVRFINNLSGKDVITEAEEGTILLAVGDRAGVKLPRACRTGLCGSCTCEVQDPQAIATDTNPREGFATIRACSTRCYVPEGMDEMVVDVHRMRARTTAGATSKGTGSSSGINSPVEASYADPMARFSGDWEKEFRPQWELQKLLEGKGLVGPSSNPKVKSSICTSCKGAGRVVCYACTGRGVVLMGSGKYDQCNTCVGRMTVGCGYCRGTGKKMKG